MWGNLIIDDGEWWWRDNLIWFGNRGEAKKESGKDVSWGDAEWNGRRRVR